jgi:hypothetical protein
MALEPWSADLFAVHLHDQPPDSPGIRNGEMVEALAHPIPWRNFPDSLLAAY